MLKKFLLNDAGPGQVAHIHFSPPCQALSDANKNRHLDQVVQAVGSANAQVLDAIDFFDAPSLSLEEVPKVCCFVASPGYRPEISALCQRSSFLASLTGLDGCTQPPIHMCACVQYFGIDVPVTAREIKRIRTPGGAVGVVPQAGAAAAEDGGDEDEDAFFDEDAEEDEAEQQQPQQGQGQGKKRAAGAVASKGDNDKVFVRPWISIFVSLIERGYQVMMPRAAPATAPACARARPSVAQRSPLASQPLAYSQAPP